MLKAITYPGETPKGRRAKGLLNDESLYTRQAENQCKLFVKNDDGRYFMTCNIQGAWYLVPCDYQRQIKIGTITTDNWIYKGHGNGWGRIMQK